MDLGDQLKNLFPDHVPAEEPENNMEALRMKLLSFKGITGTKLWIS